MVGERSSKRVLTLTYEPGDSLGILPQNDPAMVGAVLGGLLFGLLGRTAI